MLVRLNLTAARISPNAKPRKALGPPWGHNKHTLVARAAVASTTPFASSALGDGFSVGQAALLVGLVSRPELVGSSVTLRSFDNASSRWAVTLDTTGESICVKAPNRKNSIFKPGDFAADAT